MEWPINEVARLAGTTSRTLRHYGDVGLVHPSRMGSNGYRYYDERALERLQRVLLLRELGLGISAIAQVLDGHSRDEAALETHVQWLRAEKDRIDRQIASVELTIRKLKGGEQIMAEEMFDGFDHTQYKEEVEQRWGKSAYAESDNWWRSMSASDKSEWMSRQRRLGTDWAEAAARGIDPAGAEAQELARRHAEWLGSIPGTPRNGSQPSKEYVLGLGEMYVADERFARNYGGVEGATFVRDAMRTYAEANL